MRKEIASTKNSASNGEAGFTLIEVACAMLILFIALIGVVFALSYSISYNAGNSSRSKALAILQQEVEQMRAGKFTPTVTDSSLTGGTKTLRTVTLATGEQFTIQDVVDNDPFYRGCSGRCRCAGPYAERSNHYRPAGEPEPGMANGCSLDGHSQTDTSKLRS